MITQVNVKPYLDREDNLRGVASVTFDNAFTIHGLRIMDGKNGLFVSMPSRKDQDGVYRDIFHPVTKEGREFLQKRVLEGYDKARDKALDDLFRGESAPDASSGPEAPAVLPERAAAPRSAPSRTSSRSR